MQQFPETVMALDEVKEKELQLLEMVTVRLPDVAVVANAAVIALVPDPEIMVKPVPE